MVHTTESSRLYEILNQGKLLTMECNVFAGEKLCYLFVGSPAYKYESEGEAPYWMLPTVFVVRFQNLPQFKRIYPFDSGAFSHKKLPDYITTFARDDFEFGPDANAAATLVSVFFGSDKRYLSRSTPSIQEFRDKHNLNSRYMQIEALHRLYGDRSNSFDDRAAVVEAQLDTDVILNPADLLGVVVPEEFLRDSDVKSALKAITSNIESYGIYPLNVQMYFGQIYDCVRRIYDAFGILN